MYSIHELPVEHVEKVSFIAIGCNTSWVNLASSSKLKQTLRQKGYDIMLDRVIAMPLTLMVETTEEVRREQRLLAKVTIADIAKDLVGIKCIYDCPVQAISPRFSKFVPIKSGYRTPQDQ